ncbi:undecaprenyldiphospho-muramoylpentapeptide beta-N-acetylglucosaminyltransferase [Christensenellaceae bacterium OttesenSCG-928-L17]|nr:undecaprenyldiphospho-muramoylpentapeptide beta-N-acetylglucosaminyltransferase [Christensenellaceae bacterium OttesenSCG-928-L17]
MAIKAIFTGGGSAGHVTPNIALMRTLLAEGYELHYIGTAEGIEHELIARMEQVTYHSIHAGKLRRYFSLKNIADAFRVLRGIGEARRIVKRVQPDVLFSKGGFVSVPAVIGAKGRCPVVVHESDYSPGLSNKIANRYATTVCVTFEDTLAHVGAKGVFTGTPIRKELYAGNAARGFQFTGLAEGKPVLLMMGGSLGAAAVNEALREALPQLLQNFQVVHLCGKGKTEPALVQEGYVQYEFISEELPDLLAMADIVLARAGANAVFEFLALQKPALLIPLPLSASRGDQIQNAAYFQKKGYADVLAQEELCADTLYERLIALYRDRLAYIDAMRLAPHADGTEAVLSAIRAAVQSNAKQV